VCKRSRRRTCRRSLQTCELRAQLAGRHRSALWQGPCPGQRSPPQREFIEFLKLLDAAYLARIVIKLILDNHSAHISKETKAWIAELLAGRFFTTAHGSWLNLIQGFFPSSPAPFFATSALLQKSASWPPSTTSTSIP
jgi:hypothetical protein